MIRACFALLMVYGMLWAVPARAHDLKVFSSRHLLPEGSGKSVVFLSWGHRLPVDELFDGSTLVRFERIAPGELPGRKLQANGVSVHAQPVEWTEAGAHVIVAQKAPAIYSYVVDAAGDRKLKRGGKNDQKEGSVESGTQYEQYAKAIVVVGEAGGEAPARLGLNLEICPVSGPKIWKPRTPLKFLVLSQGKPVPFAEIVARPVGHKPDEVWPFATESNRQGEFSLVAETAGVWVIRAQQKTLAPRERREAIDWIAQTSTLTLEIAP